MIPIVKLIHGSHLYGTQTENSDRDFKGVYIPSLRDVLLNRAPKAISDHTKVGNGKNAPTDVDLESFSLQYFFKLAAEGETVAIDMLHAPLPKWVKYHPLWVRVHENRSLFHTKNMRAFVGYARKQAAKYGVKGSRLADAKAVRDYIALSQDNGAKLLRDIWEMLPISDNLTKHTDRTPWEYNVCGRRIQETVKLGYARSVVANFIESYGERAKLAEQNQGVDFKAISHAFRAGFQVLEILDTGDLKFPLLQCAFLRDIKLGNYTWAQLGPELNALLDDVELAASQSSLPEKVDQDKIDEFLLELLHQAYDMERG